MKKPAPARLRRVLPPAPAHLTPDAARWWDRVVKEWELDDAGQLILVTALEAFDRMKGAAALVAAQGILVKDRFGQQKLNPASLIERDSRGAMLTALRQLHLDLEPLNDRIGRPPGS